MKTSRIGKHGNHYNAKGTRVRKGDGSAGHASRAVCGGKSRLTPETPCAFADVKRACEQWLMKNDAEYRKLKEWQVRNDARRATGDEGERPPHPWRGGFVGEKGGES